MAETDEASRIMAPHGLQPCANHWSFRLMHLHEVDAMCWLWIWSFLLPEHLDGWVHLHIVPKMNVFEKSRDRSPCRINPKRASFDIHNPREIVSAWRWGWLISDIFSLNSGEEQLSPNWMFLKKSRFSRQIPMQNISEEGNLRQFMILAKLSQPDIFFSLYSACRRMFKFPGPRHRDTFPPAQLISIFVHFERKHSACLCDTLHHRAVPSLLF